MIKVVRKIIFSIWLVDYMERQKDSFQVSFSTIMSPSFHGNCEMKPAKVVEQDVYKRTSSSCKVKASSLLQND